MRGVRGGGLRPASQTSPLPLQSNAVRGDSVAFKTFSGILSVAMSDESKTLKPLYLPTFDGEDPSNLELKATGFQSSPEMVTDFNWEFTKRHLGEIVIESQFIEAMVKQAIAALLDNNDPVTGYLMTADMDFERMIRVLFALFCHKFPDHPNTEEFKGILTECNQCRQRRNFIVHAYWLPSDDGNGLCLKHARTQFGKPYTLASIGTITADTLREDVAKCTAAWRRLRQFTSAHIPGAQ